jgi:hypothetical protein
LRIHPGYRTNTGQKNLEQVFQVRSRKGHDLPARGASIMALIPDKSKLRFQETDVDLTQPAWNKRQDAYSLALYPEAGAAANRGVLVVTMIVEFDFKDGSATWTKKEKDDFLAKYIKDCTAGWAEKHRLTTTRPECDINDVGVIFDIQAKESASGNQWTVTCKKLSTHDDTNCRAGTKTKWNRADLDSFDLNLVTPFSAPTTFKRQSAVHEFGHMLGYQDEYPDPGGGKFLDNASHPADKDSMMYWGDTIYPRHYVLFADWLSLQWMKKDPAHCRGHDWKVNGLIDMTNALL